MLGKNGLHIRIQQEKSYQNDKLFYLGFEKVLKMQASVSADSHNCNRFFMCEGSNFIQSLKEFGIPLTIGGCCEDDPSVTLEKPDKKRDHLLPLPIDGEEDQSPVL